MIINPDYLSLLKENEVDEARGLFFGFLISHRKEYPELQNYILDDCILPYEKFQPLQINLCRVNAETGERELKVPFYSFQEYGEFDLFKQKLAKAYIGSMGHLNNPRDFSIFGVDDKTAYEEFKSKCKDFDMDKLVKIVASYYERAQYATSLFKYLKSNAQQDWILG